MVADASSPCFRSSDRSDCTFSMANFLRSAPKLNLTLSIGIWGKFVEALALIPNVTILHSHTPKYTGYKGYKGPRCHIEKEKSSSTRLAMGEEERSMPIRDFCLD